MGISMIEVSSLTLIDKTLLSQGEFVEAGEYERLREMQEFVRCLKNETIFLSDHISVPFSARVKLPEQKEELIAGIQKLIDDIPEKELRRFRDEHPLM
ncbi:MAG TPA: hypothetical protein DCZ56_03710 [Sutterella sp.]|nr:hypothetical protein [Sutterella sp.]